MKGWNLETIRRIRDEVASEMMQPIWKVRKPNPRTIIVYQNEEYGCFEIQSSKGSTENNLELFLNIGLGSLDFLRKRGFGPEKPQAAGDCQYWNRIEYFGRFSTVDQNYLLRRDDPASLDDFVADLRKYCRSTLAPWFLKNIGYTHMNEIEDLSEARIKRQ